MAINKVPEWPPHKRPDIERDKYGPLPNTKLPPLKKAKHKNRPKPHNVDGSDLSKTA